MFRKPKKKPTALRGSTANNDDGDANNNGTFSTTSNKKRRRPRKNSSSSEEGNSSDHGDKSDGEGTSDLLQQIRQEQEASKSNKKSSTTLLNTSSTSNKRNKDSNNMMHQYKSSNNQMSAQEMATRTAEYHPAENTKKSADGNNNSAAVDANAKISALQSNQPTNKFHAGPLRATTFVRTTARFDYQPDICKDYKETGFCGFGDTCIYLHDRGDTKTGWQMEQEYEEKKKREEERRGKEVENFMNSMKEGGSRVGDVHEEEEDVTGRGRDDDGLPFACHICRGPFKNPIVTTCGHYFCEKCMLQRIREGNAGCPVCQKDTHGVLNFPQKLVGKKRRLVGRDGTWEEYLEKMGNNIDEE